MIYTLVFGTPVRSGNHEFGTVSRIIVNNGVANQFTVNPAGLFSGPNRLVPISDVVDATEDGVTLDISETDWKAYPAFDIERLVVADQAAAPDLLTTAPLSNEATTEAVNVPTAEAPAIERSLHDVAVALTSTTLVGDMGRLRGMVADTGIPQQLLVEGGSAVAFEQVGVIDEKHIVLGEVDGRRDGATASQSSNQAQQRMDGATPPGTIGQERRHDA